MAHRFCSALLLGVWLAAGVGLADDYVVPLDLTRHVAEDKRPDLKKLEDGVYEWALPDGKAQRVFLDIEKLGVDPARYDEIRFEIKPLVSQVGLTMTVHGHLAPGEVSNWYLKFKTQTGQWSEGRYDLHLDDDGIWLKGGPEHGTGKWLRVRLYRRILGYPGEPEWRKAHLRNVRLVRRRIAADFSLLETQIEQDEAEVAYVYTLHVKNQTDKAQSAKVDLDSARSLHFFRVSGPETIELKAGEAKDVPIRVFIPRTEAMALPALYSEAAFPKVYLDGVPDSDVVALRGYRRFPMWGTVPIFNKRTREPVTFGAHLAGREKAMPAIKGWKASVLGRANGALKHDWPVPDFGPPEHDQRYRCDKCRCWLKAATPTSLHKHVCPKCGEVHENVHRYDYSYLMRYNNARAHQVEALALAWLISGEEKYAEKATEMLLNYADGYSAMPTRNRRSTSGGARLGANTLHASYVIPAFARGYFYLREAPCLDEEEREKIVHFLKRAGVAVCQHSVEYNNQQAEHFRAYGSVGLATDFWPLAAEAIHGEFGWHEVVEYGYSEDGIAHEGGAYHHSVFNAMNGLGAFAYGMGINLYTARFKRVFDGSLSAGMTQASYELAYRVYKDPSYIPLLADRQGGRAGEAAALYGVLGLPDVTAMRAQSVHMPGAGYLFLKKGNAADYSEVRLNYIKQFDRHEHDRFTTFLFRNSRQVDSTVGRITYGSPRCGWMGDTAAHNCIVVNGESQKAPEGRLVAVDLSPDAPIAVVESRPETPFYPGVRHIRCIALLGDAYVVFDRVSAQEPRTIDRYQWGRGKAKLSFEAAPVEALPHLPKRGQFEQISGGACGKELLVEFENALKMRLVSDAELHAYTAVTVGGYQADPMEVTFARRAKAKDAAFLAAFTLGEASQPPALKIINTDMKELVFQVLTPDKNYTVRIRPDEKSVSVE